MQRLPFCIVRSVPLCISGAVRIVPLLSYQLDLMAIALKAHEASLCNCLSPLGLSEKFAGPAECAISVSG